MNEKIRCVAIDDEPPALAVIQKFCERLGDVELHVFTDPLQGLDYIRHTEPQIAFLDIEMDGINGLSIATRLPEATCFVITTAYIDYALKGYELDAVDYLHKPFPYERFRAAFDKALRRLGEKKARAEVPPIVVKQNYSNVSIAVSDILYLEARECYTRIYRASGPPVETRQVLKSVAEQLPADRFLRIHRSFIVARDKVTRYSRREVGIGHTAVPVGRQYAAETLRQLGGGN